MVGCPLMNASESPAFWERWLLMRGETLLLVASLIQCMRNLPAELNVPAILRTLNGGYILQVLHNSYSCVELLVNMITWC